jgi:flagellar hook-length control protein FliK
LKQPTPLNPTPGDDADDVSAHAKSPGLSASPPGAVPEITDLISVVRSVGNAEQGNQAASQGADSHHDAPHSPAPADAAASNAAAPLSAQLTPATATATPAPAGSAAPAHIPPPVEQVARTVIEQVQQGGGEAKLHLHPAELGEVVIRVHTDGDHVRVEVHADHAEAMNLLRDHTADLSNLLGGRGLNLADVYVGLGGQSAGSNGQDQPSSREANSPANGEFAAILGVDQPAGAIDTHLRLRAAYNPDGALSYRV